MRRVMLFCLALLAPAMAEAADLSAYGHAVDCMAATMSGRKIITDSLPKTTDPMQAFYAGPSWARRMHELARQTGKTDATAEADGTARLAAASKAVLAGHPLFDSAFILACFKATPRE
jgi:hypothetical protein